MNNLLIQGDNVVAMKWLIENGYKGKIDLVYIDPPFATGGTFAIDNDGRVDNYFVGENGYWHTCAIDCGTNEDLFLAIAALREDSDYMQFFTDGTEFILCDRYDWIDMYSVLCSGLSNAKDRVKELDKFQKATAEELIEHFKN